MTEHRELTNKLPLGNPLVSVLVTAYNSEAYIIDCLKSIFRQRYKNIEIVIVDDASTDSTLELINQFEGMPNLKIIKNIENKGYTKSFNIGLNNCRGEFITFCDSDDTIDEAKIEMQVSFLLHRKCSVLGTDIKRISNSGEIISFESYPRSHDSILEKALIEGEMTVCGSSLMISRQVYNRIGGYDLFFDRAPFEDFDWLLRISREFDIGNLNVPLYNYRFNPNSLTRKVSYQYRKRLAKYLAIEFYKAGNKLTFQDKVDILKKTRKKVYKNRSHLYLSTSIELAINQNFKKAFKDFLKIRISKVGLYKYLKASVIIIILILLPLSLLLKLKNKFGINHVSQL